MCIDRYDYDDVLEIVCRRIRDHWSGRSVGGVIRCGSSVCVYVQSPVVGFPAVCVSSAVVGLSLCILTLTFPLFYWPSNKIRLCCVRRPV